MADQMYDCGVKMMGGDETSRSIPIRAGPDQRAAHKKYLPAVEFLIKFTRRAAMRIRKRREWRCRYGLDEELLSGDRLSAALKIVLVDEHFDGTAERRPRSSKYAVQARERLARGSNDAQPLRRIAGRLDLSSIPAQSRTGALPKGRCSRNTTTLAWVFDMDMRRADAGPGILGFCGTAGVCRDADAEGRGVAGMLFW